MVTTVRKERQEHKGLRESKVILEQTVAMERMHQLVSRWTLLAVHF
jgi:hypothetical protein